MGYVEGFTGEIQRILIGIAEEQGLSPAAVQPNTWAGANGWTVPDSVSDAYAASLTAPVEEPKAPKKRAPRKTAEAEAPEEAPSDPDSEQE